MSWTKLAPVAKTSGRPMASASIAVNKDQVPKVLLFLAGSLIDEFGGQTRADISAGEGEHEGSLLVEFDPKGAFEFKKGVAGTVRTFVPLPAGCPDRAVSSLACTLGQKTRSGDLVVKGAPPALDSVVIKLPIADWRAALADRPAARPAASAPPPPVGGQGAPKKFDMVEYLSGKGVKISRLAENRYSVDGETLVFGQVLKLVNDRRKAADLDPISITHAW